MQISLMITHNIQQELLKNYDDSQAFRASEAILMVCFSKNCHYFTFDELSAGEAFGAKEALVVSTTVMSAIFCVEAVSGKWLPALCSATRHQQQLGTSSNLTQPPLLFTSSDLQ